MKIKIEIETGNEDCETWVDIMYVINHAIQTRPINSKQDQIQPSAFKAILKSWNGDSVGEIEVTE